MAQEIRVAIVGCGNCASALVQGLNYYRHHGPSSTGLMMSVIGDSIRSYGPSDIRIVAAFDVAEGKVGQRLSQALLAHPNNTIRFFDDEPVCGDPIVVRGPTLDGLGYSLRSIVEESDLPAVSVAGFLQHMAVDVVVIYLPVGSQQAAEHYAEAALVAGCALVNCIPVFLASNPAWAERARVARVPFIGDDIKSQFGATIVHRALATLMRQRGIKLVRTSQLNVGGNSDFLNMLDRSRLESKKKSKTMAVTSVADPDLVSENIHVGPSDYVPWLRDRKWAHVRLEGEGFGGVPLSIELKLEVWDSPNSAGVVIDAIRCAKLAMDRGEAGALVPPSAWYMKSPPAQVDDDTALENLRSWVSGEE